MEVSFNLKLEFNYVLVNYQNPTVCKIKKNGFFESTRRRIKVYSNWKHIYFTPFFLQYYLFH